MHAKQDALPVCLLINPPCLLTQTVPALHLFSNVPSAVLCVSLAQPIIAQLPLDDPFAKALLIGIAIRYSQPDVACSCDRPPTSWSAR